MEKDVQSQIGKDFFNSDTQNEAKAGDKSSASSFEQKMAEYEEKVAELKDALVRSMAEMENLKKRHQKDVESMAKYGITKILKDLIEPFDQLFMALAIKVPAELEKNDAFISIISGIDMTKKAFEKAFEVHGLKRFYPHGEKFDHNLHQAISQVKQENVEAGIVVNVVQAGYVLHERVVKPAMVIVSV